MNVVEDRLKNLARHFDHTSDAFRDNRQKFYDWLHRSGQTMIHSDQHGGFWYAIRYQTVLNAQRNPEIFSNSKFTIPARPVPPLIPATRDAPEHTVYKKMLTPFFTPNYALGLAGRIEDLAVSLIGAGIQYGRFDMVHDVMIPLMSELTMTDILGLDVAKAAPYAEPVHHLTERGYPREKAEAELHWLEDQLRADLRGGLVAPGAVLGRLQHATYEDRPLTEEEILLIATNLLIGGLGTTAFFTGSVTVFLGRNPEHRRMLIMEPAIISNAVDELLRVFTPTQNFGRLVMQDIDMEGVTLRKGDMILLGYGGANHDPTVFTNPLCVDFKRETKAHIAFGIGPHRCLGAHVAKLVVAIVLKTLLRLAPEYRLVEAEVIQNKAAVSMFGYNRVPLAVTA